ncbi:diguanylate cyclase domain-containing protein [Acetobacterium tundrae]|uniref:Stage 0 sporulation protein A homolog n=1 Tax=Acetobacterium tundrae TaxID=132932 RepID=A0ABR6WH12_9FIRM|nr:diguanylate cyclase [Acetobacterium tundrae]MBC3795445.1 diguanylate cyclase [Acetobacterium tundrae]
MKSFYDTNSQNEILERIFSLTLGLLCVTNLNGQFLKVNAAWKITLGYSMNELTQKNLIDFVHPNDLDATLFAIKELINQNDVLNFTNRYRSKEGTYCYIEWELHRYGNFLYIAARDIAQTKISEVSNQEFKNNIDEKQEQNRNNHESSLSKRQRVLIVDDSPLNTKVLEQSLSGDYDVLVAHSGMKALSIANSTEPPDIILLDIVMPEMNGYEVCKKLHLNQSTKELPIIFLTSLNQADSEEYGLKLGAIDYITKPFSIAIVKAKIKNHLALKYYQDVLKINTDVDQLTNIANRRRFDEMLSIEIKKSKRTGSHLSLLMIDIDHFKLYNDTYGHLEGDECLRKVAFILKSTLKRPGDLAARWGGEEFTCLLPDTDNKGAAKIAELLRIAIMDLRILHNSSPVKKVVTISIGAATSNPSDEASYETLLRHADDALYKAKASGRNRISIEQLSTYAHRSIKAIG